MALTREQILGAKDIRVEKVLVPEWGGEVYVKTLTAAEQDNYELGIVELKNGKPNGINKDRIRSLLCVYALCDENGESLFTEKDINALGKKSASALSRVMEAAQRLSNITEEDIEQLAEGLKKDPSGDSPSD